MKTTYFQVFTILLSLSSCAQLIEGRSFISEMDKETDLFLVPGRDFRTVSGDSGKMYRSDHEIMERTPANYRSKEEYLQQKSLLNELTWRENQLSEQERIRYQQVAGYLPTESEKIYFLSLSPYEREDYLNARGAYPSEQAQEMGHMGRSPASVLSYSSYGESQSTGIALGMNKDRVMDVYGHPTRVDVAGNPRLENERWAFIENGRVRYVYFEGGVVQGWAMD